MIESLPIALMVGTALGFLSGLGVGGGSLLILWLTMALHMPQSDARAINLLFFIPSAVIACLFRLKQKTLNLGKLLPAILSGCAAGVACSYLANDIDTGLLRKLFGIILLATGVRELLYKEKTQK